MTTVRIDQFDVPEIEVPSAIPELPSNLYEGRFKRLERAREEAGLDCVIVYADREHFANMAWLTGFAPRFEEALWVQAKGSRRPTLLVGNECLPLARQDCRLDPDLRLYQEFSLPDQARDVSIDLIGLLRGSGLQRGMRCGLIGWKPMEQIELPFWIVDAVRESTSEEPINVNGLLMDPGAGLRVRVEIDAVPFFEYASSVASVGVMHLLRNLRDGQSELEAASALQHYGLELSCHPMVNFGRPILTGLRSPRNARVVRGEYVQTALGLVGGLTSRAGRLIGPNDPDQDDYLDLVADYLLTVRAWYSEVKVGARAADVVAATLAAKASWWDLALNPGHILGLDEWVSSPFWSGSPHALQAGMALQQDLIPIPRQGAAAVNMEDGFLLADGALRRDLWRSLPGLMARCERRRNIMDQLGFEISEDVLPFSNAPGVFMPYLLAPSYVAAFA